MSSSINTITVSGNLGKDPELKEFDSGTKKCILSVAVSEFAKEANNQWGTKTIWLSVEFWGREAEFLAKYARKGAFIVVSGRLSEDSWEKDGETRRRFFIKGDSFQLPKINSEKITEDSLSNPRSNQLDSHNDFFDENTPF